MLVSEARAQKERDFNSLSNKTYFDKHFKDKWNAHKVWVIRHYDNGKFGLTQLINGVKLYRIRYTDEQTLKSIGYLN